LFSYNLILETQISFLFKITFIKTLMYPSSADFNGRFRLKGKSRRSPISWRLQNPCFF